jgi:hypothetical protein
VAVQGELSDSVEVPNWGWARGKLMTQSRSRQISLIWTARRFPAQFITVITITEKKKLRTERKKNCEKEEERGYQRKRGQESKEVRDK